MYKRHTCTLNLAHNIRGLNASTTIWRRTYSVEYDGSLLKCYANRSHQKFYALTYWLCNNIMVYAV